jgi:alpha-beta hydrolase superfamily lysophospholipase
MPRRQSIPAVLTLLLCLAVVQPAVGQASTSFTLRSKTLTLHIYGRASGDPVVVASGDGGWLHLGPHAAEVLGRAGYFVVGVDSKEYLSLFTSGSKTLRPEEVPGDFRALAQYAAQQSNRSRAFLVGVSEGAGLSVLAASDSRTRAAVRGVIALGLPDINELAWRWRDSIIYLTKQVPDEPTFSVGAIIDKVSPMPLAALHSTADEFVPIAEIQRLMQKAKEPKQLWIIRASNHRFSGNEKEFDARLIEAMTWVRAQK